MNGGRWKSKNWICRTRASEARQMRVQKVRKKAWDFDFWTLISEQFP